MLIGYASPKLAKLCQQAKTARKELPQGTGELLFQRLAELAAFERLRSIPIGATPLHLHPLRGDRAGQFAVWICKKFRIVFAPAGQLEVGPDGNPDPLSATEIEIVFVGDYHDG